jgi:DNA-directed RNA polymerase subunit K/omega
LLHRGPHRVQSLRYRLVHMKASRARYTSMKSNAPFG